MSSRNPRTAEPAPARVRWWQRLSLRIYLALLGSLVLAACLLVGVFILGRGQGGGQQAARMAEISKDAAAVLPPVGASAPEQQAGLERWQGTMDADLALFSPERKLLAATGRKLPPLPATATQGWKLGFDGVTLLLRLPDGRWLMVRPHRESMPSQPVVGLLMLIAFAMAVVAYPVARRITARLERLQRSVEDFGSGQLGARVVVEGRDEIARLAQSFNRSAAQVENLLTDQKRLLANASHELRSPLARVRIATELLREHAGPELSAELARNIGELDQLIDEILLASRLNTQQPVSDWLDTDLAGLAAEECARVDASLSASACVVRGDAKLLRRLLRNLLENARRYGGGSDIEVDLVKAADGRVTLEVCDHGPGIPEAEREAIFEPFYRLPGSRERDGGVGLGLSLVRQIARAHGGEVRCRQRADGGNCFVVVMPG